MGGSGISIFVGASGGSKLSTIVGASSVASAKPRLTLLTNTFTVAGQLLSAGRPNVIEESLTV